MPPSFMSKPMDNPAGRTFTPLRFGALLALLVFATYYPTKA